MKARIKWVEDVAVVAESGSGHAIVIDGPPDHGGRNLGPRPMEMVLMGLGACSAFDVVSILEKSRQRVSSCHVELDAERADAVPAVFTRVHMRFVVRGQSVRESVCPVPWSCRWRSTAPPPPCCDRRSPSPTTSRSRRASLRISPAARGLAGFLNARRISLPRIYGEYSAKERKPL